MNKKSSHVEKNRAERQYYQRYIESAPPDPTIVDDSIKFHPSNEFGEEFSRPSAPGVRKPPLTQRIIDHFSEHWLEWIIGIFSIVLIFLVYDAKANIGVFDERLTNQKDTLTRIETNLNEDIQDQQEDINIINQTIESIKESINDIKITTSELLLRLEFIEEMKSIEEP
jgi:hypothetical protein